MQHQCNTGLRKIWQFGKFSSSPVSWFISELLCHLETCWPAQGLKLQASGPPPVHHWSASLAFGWRRCLLGCPLRSHSTISIKSRTFAIESFLAKLSIMRYADSSRNISFGIYGPPVGWVSLTVLKDFIHEVQVLKSVRLWESGERPQFWRL